MMAARPFVTIGSHHHGPHVDALYSLAERVGALVIVVAPDGHAAPRHDAKIKVRRQSYAGFEPSDLNIRAWRETAR